MQFIDPMTIRMIRYPERCVIAQLCVGALDTEGVTPLVWRSKPMWSEAEAYAVTAAKMRWFLRREEIQPGTIEAAAVKKQQQLTRYLFTSSKAQPTPREKLRLRRQLEIDSFETRHAVRAELERSRQLLQAIWNQDSDLAATLSALRDPERFEVWLIERQQWDLAASFRAGLKWPEPLPPEEAVVKPAPKQRAKSVPKPRLTVEEAARRAGLLADSSALTMKRFTTAQELQQKTF